MISGSQILLQTACHRIVKVRGKQEDRIYVDAARADSVGVEQWITVDSFTPGYKDTVQVPARFIEEVVQIIYQTQILVPTR